MLQETRQLSLQFLSLFPEPLHLIIEGSTNSGKTWLAQHLAKDIANYTEIWRHFNYSEIYSIIPDAPVYKPKHYSVGDELPSIWQERASSWLDNVPNKPRCILIDQIPCLLRIDPNDLVLNFLRSVKDTNIVATTQDFEVKRGLVEHSLESCFSLIRLGENAKRYAEFVLGDTRLLQKLELARYPCLYQDKVIDLAQLRLNI